MNGTPQGDRELSISESFVTKLARKGGFNYSFLFSGDFLMEIAEVALNTIIKRIDKQPTVDRRCLTV